MLEPLAKDRPSELNAAHSSKWEASLFFAASTSKSLFQPVPVSNFESSDSQISVLLMQVPCWKGAAWINERHELLLRRGYKALILRKSLLPDAVRGAPAQNSL
jgi:hypothetical protein